MQTTQYESADKERIEVIAKLEVTERQNRELVSSYLISSLIVYTTCQVLDCEKVMRERYELNSKCDKIERALEESKKEIDEVENKYRKALMMVCSYQKSGVICPFRLRDLSNKNGGINLMR